MKIITTKILFNNLQSILPRLIFSLMALVKVNICNHSCIENHVCWCTNSWHYWGVSCFKQMLLFRQTKKRKLLKNSSYFCAYFYENHIMIYCIYLVYYWIFISAVTFETYKHHLHTDIEFLAIYFLKIFEAFISGAL